MLCLAREVSAVKLDCQQLIPPGREKYFSEEYRDVLAEIYHALYVKKKSSTCPFKI